MPFCSGCGNELASDVGFCPRCGKPISSAVAPGGAGASSPPAVAGSGIEENVAALLSYVLGWLTGLIFFLIDKRPYVRFHAMQSILTFGGLHVINLLLVFGGVMGGFAGGMMGGFLMGGISWMLYALFSLVVLVAWVLCMVKAYQGERFKLPVVGNLAENFSK